MKLFHRTSAIPFYLIHTGFRNFKARIQEELATSGVNLDDVVDEDTLHVLYRNGESPDFVAASIAYGED